MELKYIIQIKYTFLGKGTWGHLVLTVDILKNGIMSIWCKNILDKRYPIRGFYFGIEPPNFEDKLYLQWGDPVQYGISLKYQF